MPFSVQWCIAWVAAYVVGSIPFGYLIARSRGVDIREHGSGNIGATNVGRVLGRRLGIVCFVLDVLKGLLPSVVAGIVMGTIGQPSLSAMHTLAWLGVPVGAIAGHMFPIWLGFRGGKGVATGLGALAGIFPVLTIAALGVLVVWIVCVRVTRYVGVSSCIAAMMMPVFTVVSSVLTQPPLPGSSGRDAGEVFAAGWPYFGVTGLLAVIVVYKHRGNIARTFAGTEMKIGQRVEVGGSKT